MASTAPARISPRSSWALRARALSHARARYAVVTLGLGLLVLFSLTLRLQNMDVGYWIDEGLSVGIADRPVGEIPGVLRLDGSPPLYYLALSVWMGLVGSTGESATHALSLIFALLTVPLAFAFARGFYGARAGWIAAALFALSPFLTQYAQETRMYALVMLLGTLATGAFLIGFVHRRRWALPVFVAALVLELYTHNYALFFGATLGLAWLVLLLIVPPGERRGLARDGVLAFGAVALLYAPWLPALVFQAEHTGAPWSERPGLTELWESPAGLLGSVEQVALLLAGGAGAMTVLGGRSRGREAQTVIALVLVGLGTIVLAWGASQVSPAWALRYLSVAVPPLLLLSALGLARAGRLGLVGLAVVVLAWSGATGRTEKSNVREVAESLTPSVRPGDLVISTQPEQVPVLAYYLPGGLSWATLWGPVPDLGVTDWRDGVERLERTSVRRNLRPLLDELPRGRRLVLVEPTIYTLERWSAPWTELVRVRSQAWSRALSEDPRFAVSAIYPPSPFPERPNPVKATVFIKRS